MLYVHLWLHIEFTKLRFAIVNSSCRKAIVISSKNHYYTQPLMAYCCSWTFNIECIRSEAKVLMGTSNDNDWFFSHSTSIKKNPEHIHEQFVLSKQYANIKHIHVSTMHMQKKKMYVQKITMKDER